LCHEILVPGVGGGDFGAENVEQKFAIDQKSETEVFARLKIAKHRIRPQIRLFIEDAYGEC